MSDNTNVAPVDGHDGIFSVRGGGQARAWNGIQYKGGLSAKNVAARRAASDTNSGQRCSTPSTTRPAISSSSRPAYRTKCSTSATASLSSPWSRDRMQASGNTSFRSSVRRAGEVELGGARFPRAS